MIALNVPYPKHLTTKVRPHLHVGGSWRRNADPFDVVLTVADPSEVAAPPPHAHAATWPLMDAGWVDEEAVHALADLAADSAARGLRTLVRCHAGLNRSALVVAVAALALDGGEPTEVIARMRRRRSPYVLHNRVFERYLLNLQ